MRRNINNVKIVEPPFEEFSKKYSHSSGCKRACGAGCFFVLLFIIGSVIFLRVAMGPGPQTLAKVPSTFPSDIPVYDPDAIEKITFVSGKYKDRGIEIAAFFPKLILSPLFLALDKQKNAPANGGTLESVKNLWKLIATPVGDHRDTAQIEWKNLDAEPNFVISYYKTNLKKSDYTIEVESEGEGMRQFTFSKDKITGSLFIQTAETDHPGTDYAVLTVNLPTETASQ